MFVSILAKAHGVTKTAAFSVKWRVAFICTLDNGSAPCWHLEQPDEGDRKDVPLPFQDMILHLHTSLPFISYCQVLNIWSHLSARGFLVWMAMCVAETVGFYY